MRQNSITEKHFDYKHPDFYKDCGVPMERIEAFFECMPDDVKKLIDKEYAKAKEKWLKDPEAYYLKSIQGDSDTSPLFGRITKDSWFRRHFPWFIVGRYYGIRRFIREWKECVLELKCYKWYYPVTDVRDNIKATIRDIKTKYKYGYVNQDIWNFDWEIGNVMVPRLLAVKKMERHCKIRNKEASEKLYAKTGDPMSYVEYTPKQWNVIMNKIVFGFMNKEFDEFDMNESMRVLPSDSYWRILVKVNEAQEEGRVLFAKHYHNLSD